MNKAAKIPVSKLISPHGLSIIDSLFRLPDQELEEFANAFQYCKEFSLNQPRLSQLMHPLNTKSLLFLKNHLKRKNVSWWKKAFIEPQNRRYLPLFVEHMKAYHSKADKPPKAMKVRDRIYPGPVELAKRSHLLRDENHYYWGEKPALNQLKKEYRLIPGEGGRDPTWYLAEIKSDANKISVAGKGSFHKIDFPSNRFRAIYDLLYFDESRINEIIPELIRKILNEV